MRRLSATSLRTYLRCPQQWKLKYVDRLPEEPKPFFNLGSAVHAALEVMYDGRVASPAPLLEMIRAFEEEFDPEAYPSEEERERRRADGLRMVRDFHEEHAGEEFRPAMAVEKRISFEVDGIPFHGVVDRIDKVDDGRLRIVDYKTGGSLDLDRVRTDRQLTLYQLGVESQFGMEVEALVLYHVPTQTPFEAAAHGPGRVEEVRAEAREVARGIRDEEFEPDPGHYCRWCDFQPHCPAFADEYPENWREEGEAPVPSPQDAARLADRYGELEARKEEVESELEEVESALERYFQETGARAASGQAYRVSASRREAWRIDDDEALREILEPEGLWDRVLVTRADWRQKAALPDDTTLPDDVRERVRELARKKVMWRLRVGEVESPEDGAGGDRGDPIS